MNSIDFIIKAYEMLYNRRGVSPYVFTPFRRLVRKIGRTSLPRLLENEKVKLSNNKSDIIVSLTSFPGRIEDVHLVILCLLRQTVMPKRIILWLSKEQFDNVEIPKKLKDLENETFSIIMVDQDLRSHKKYHYVLRDYPNSKIFLTDDDIYYPSDMIENVQNESIKYQDCIICRHGSIMKYDKAGQLLPYNDWWWELSEASDNQNFFFGSGGGVLFSLCQLHEDVLDSKLAMTLAPMADDVWLNAMVNLKGTKKRKIKCGILLEVESQQKVRLTSENVGNKKNDTQIQNVQEYYMKKALLKPFENKE